MQTLAAPNITTVSSSQPGHGHWVWAVLTGLIGIAFACLFGVCIWGLDKGFDPNVEGFYMLSYQHPELYPSFSAFHVLLSKIPHLVANEIVHYRILELIGRIAAPAVLAVAVLRCVQPHMALTRVQQAFVVLMGCLGSLLALAIFPRTISYNGLTTALVFLAAACAVFARSSRRDAEEHKANLLVFVAGTLAALTIFVKFTSGICLIPVLVLLDCTRPRVKDIGVASLLLLAGLVAGCLGYFVLVQNPVVWWTGFSEAVLAEAKSSHQVNAAVEAMLEFVRLHLKYPCIAIAFAYGMRQLLFSENKKVVKIAFVILVTATPAVLAGLIWKDQFIESYAALGTLGLIAIALIPERLSKWGGEWTALLIGCSLLPPVATVGTNCLFFSHMASNAAPLFLLIALGTIACARKYNAPFLAALMPVFLVAFAVTDFMQRYIYERYECAALTAQTAEIPDCSILKGIKVRPSEVAFYSCAQKILRDHGFQKGDHLLCLYDLPGLNYIFEARSPGQAWYVFWEGRDRLNADFLRKSTIGSDDRFFLTVMGLDPSEPIWPEVKKCLGEHNCSFPDSFEAIGAVPSIYATPGYKEKVFFYKRKSKPQHVVAVSSGP